MYKQFMSTLFGTFIIGIPLAIITVIAIIFIPVFTLEAAYNASLFLPQKLGLISKVAPNEIVEVSGEQEQIVTLPRKGRYRIYSDEAIVLNTKITILTSDSSYSIDAVPLYDKNGSQYIDVDKPQFVFNLDAPGTYTIITISSDSEPDVEQKKYSIVPYVGNQEATVGILGILIQLGLVAFCISLFYQVLFRGRIQDEKATQDKKREQMEAFLDNEIQNKR